MGNPWRVKVIEQMDKFHLEVMIPFTINGRLSIFRFHPAVLPVKIHKGSAPNNFDLQAVGTTNSSSVTAGSARSYDG